MRVPSSSQVLAHTACGDQLPISEGQLQVPQAQPLPRFPPCGSDMPYPQAAVSWERCFVRSPPRARHLVDIPNSCPSTSAGARTQPLLGCCSGRAVGTNSRVRSSLILEPPALWARLTCEAGCRGTCLEAPPKATGLGLWSSAGGQPF